MKKEDTVCEQSSAVEGREPEAGWLIGGKYEVLGSLGSGGAGCVYRVRDCRLDKMWAAKRVQKDCAGMEESVLGKMEDEAFPRIVDVVEEEDCRFIIMDWIVGETLEKRLARTGPFAAEEVVRTGIALCEALGRLHRMQPPLLYLDLKPSNIMLDTTGRMRLVDFGSAVEAGERLTEPVAATLGYAAPEQLARQKEKRQVDVRSDVFGLGRTLYVLLGGKDPTKPPYGACRLRDCALDVPKQLEDIVERCMEPNPAERFQTMEAVKRALEAFAETRRKVSWLHWLLAAGKWMLLAPAVWRAAVFYQVVLRMGMAMTEKADAFCRMLFWAALSVLWQQIQEWYRNRKPYFETLQSVIRTEKKAGRWLFSLLLTAGLILGGQTTVQAAAAQYRKEAMEAGEEGTKADLQEKALPVVLRDTQFRKLLVKEGEAVCTEEVLYLELNPQFFREDCCMEISVTAKEETSGRLRKYSFRYCPAAPGAAD